MDLLNEDPVTASRRIDLDIKISRLQKIMAELDRFEHLESPEVQDIEANLVNDRSTSRSPICDRPRSLSRSRSRSRSPPHSGGPGHVSLGKPTAHLQGPLEVPSCDDGIFKFVGTDTTNIPVGDLGFGAVAAGKKKKKTKG